MIFGEDSSPNPLASSLEIKEPPRSQISKFVFTCGKFKSLKNALWGDFHKLLDLDHDDKNQENSSCHAGPRND